MQMDIEKYIIQGRYEDARAIYEQFGWKEDKVAKDFFFNLAYDTGSICIYNFVVYMINTTQKTFWMEVAKEIMEGALCHIEGGYSVALFYARELLKRERSVENLQAIIAFYEIPEQLIDEEELADLVEEILEKDPFNKIALRYRENK